MDKRSIDDILETIKPLTDEEKVAYLFDIIHEEVSKPWDEVDQELVAACSECAEKYNQNVAPALTEADIGQRLAEFKQKYGKKIRKPIRTSWVRKAAIIAAAVLMTCLLTLTVAAKAYGFQNVGEFVVYAMNNLFPGESVDENKITYVYNGDTFIYDSIKHWKDDVGTGFLYPSVLPDGVFVESIVRSDNDDGTYKIVVIFNDDTLSMIITNYHSVDLLVGNYPIYTTTSGLDFVIIRQRQAVYQTATHEYIIRVETNDEIERILEGMK